MGLNQLKKLRFLSVLFLLILVNCSDLRFRNAVQFCPDGYIRVPSDTTFDVSNDFCIMKFEARAWLDTNANGIAELTELNQYGCAEAACTTANWADLNLYKPVSSSIVRPWRRINANNALEACRSLGDKYDLPSNSEWMLIARNIEYVSSNWSGGAHGSGCIYSGNSGALTTCGFFSGAGAANPDFGDISNRDPKASLRLNNGEVIWDFVGNLIEPVDWVKGGAFTIVQPNEKPYVSADTAPVAGFRDFINLDANVGGNVPSLSFLPGNTTLTSAQNIGQYYGNDAVTGGAAYRGGKWEATGIGLYQLSLAPDPVTTTNHFNGFRCVYRPLD